MSRTKRKINRISKRYYKRMYSLSLKEDSGINTEEKWRLIEFVSRFKENWAYLVNKEL